MERKTEAAIHSTILYVKFDFFNRSMRMRKRQEWQRQMVGEKWKLCLVYSLFRRVWAGLDWQLVSLTHRRDKIRRWQLFPSLTLPLSLWYLPLSAIPSLVCNHSLTFHCHHALPVSQTQNSQEEGWAEKKQLTPSPHTHLLYLLCADLKLK